MAKELTAAEIQQRMESAMIALENAISECTSELDPSDLVEAGTHILGEKNIQVRTLRKWVHALDRSLDTKAQANEVAATYTSVHDGSITCTSACKYNIKTKNCFDIEMADNAEDADNADALTDEYVMVDGKKLRESDGVTFDY